MAVQRTPDRKFSSLFRPQNFDVTVTSYKSVQFRGQHHASPEHLVETIQYMTLDDNLNGVIRNTSSLLVSICAEIGGNLGRLRILN